MTRLGMRLGPVTRFLRDARPEAAPLWGFGGGILVICFLVSGLANVIPQALLLRLAPEHKAFWLPLCLFAGTISAMVGTLAGGGFWKRSWSNLWVLVPLLGTASGFCGLFVVRDPRLYLVLHVAVSGQLNFLLTRFDHLASRFAGDALRSFNDRLGTACRLLGMLLAPWYFTTAVKSVPAIAAALSVCLILSTAALLSAFGPTRVPASVETAAGSRPRPLELVDYLIIGHAVTVYGSLYIFAANIAYFLRDVAKLEDPVAHAGLLIVASYFTALCAVAASPWLSRRRPSRTERPGLLSLLTLLPIVGTLAMYECREVPSFQIMLGVSVVLGGGYGFFLLGFRNHVSRSANQGKAGMLTIYNNLANVSALPAFGSMLLLSRLAPGSSPAYYDDWLRLLVAVSLLGVPLLLWARRLCESTFGPTPAVSAEGVGQ